MRASIDQVAADWLARRFAGLSPAEEAEFLRWQAADPRHAAVYAELEATWRALDRVRLPDSVGVHPDPNALAPHRARRFREWSRPALVAAAVAVVMVGLGWAGMASKRGEAPEPGKPHLVDVSTAVGEANRLDLPDGSIVRVNTDSRVEVAYSARERRVRLWRGEAHFTVAKNPARPFFVEAGGVAVRAVGTAFNVRLRPDAIEVLVTEGRVRVAGLAHDEDLIAVPPSPAARAAPPVLAAGERVVIPAVATTGEMRGRATVAPVAPAEIERVLAWQDRRIEVEAAPLAEIVAEFNRYNRAQLVVDDPELAARRFGGTFRADDPETFVRLLETRFGLYAERRGPTTLLRVTK